MFNFDYFLLFKFEIKYLIISKLKKVFGITEIDDEAQVKTNYTSEPGGVFHMYHSLDKYVSHNNLIKFIKFVNFVKFMVKFKTKYFFLYLTVSLYILCTMW